MIRVFSKNHMSVNKTKTIVAIPESFPKPGTLSKLTELRTINKVAIMEMMGRICVKILSAKILPRSNKNL